MANLVLQMMHTQSINTPDEGKQIEQCVCLSSEKSYGRGAGLGRGRGVGAHLPVHGVGVGVGVGLAVGVGVAVGVAVGVGGANCAQYLPPVFKETSWLTSTPPQTIISLAVPTAVCRYRPVGALVVLVAIQLSVLGLYLPPLLSAEIPPQMII
jgi:hypothetical protein